MIILDEIFFILINGLIIYINITNISFNVLFTSYYYRNQTNDFSVIRDWVPYSNMTQSVKWLNFHLQHKDKVKVNLRTTNGALNTIENTTDGFIVDLTPPVLMSLGDGTEEGKDIEFQVQDTLDKKLPFVLTISLPTLLLTCTSIIEYICELTVGKHNIKKVASMIMIV